MSSDQVAQHWSLFWIGLSPCCIDHARSPRRFRLLPVIALALVFLRVTAGVASGQPFESLGTRALGMGGAFVAVADDASAPYWNPAGIATGALVAVGIEHGRVERGAEESDRLLAPAQKGSGTFVGLALPSLGISYYALTQHRSVPLPSAGPPLVPGGGQPYALSSLVTNHVAVTLAQTLLPGLHLASALKYVHGSAGEDVAIAATGDPLSLAPEIGRRGSSTFDFDLGVMLAVRRLRLGLTGRNLLEPGFKTPSDRELTLERQWRAGAALLPAAAVMVAVDVDLQRTQVIDGDRRNVAAGLEGWLFQHRLGLRTGVRASTVGDSRPVGAGGVSYAFRGAMYVDGQVSRGERPADSSWTVSARFAF